MNWDKYPNFSKEEFDCKHTGKNKMCSEFLHLLQSIRDEYGKPMFVNSGYRDSTHPEEAKKAKPGAHFYGVACDIAARGADVQFLIYLAYKHGVRRMGVYQRRGVHFLHIDIADRTHGFPQTTWTG